MSTPLFSIVTVTLNCADEAIRTAHSVLAQGFADYEYVVKDGLSSDGTVDRLAAVGVAPRAMADTGIYDAMNQALEICQGDYVCFLNAGDLFVAADVLGNVATWLERAGYPDYAYCDVRSFTQHPLQQEMGRTISYPGRIGRFYLFRKMICHQAWFMKRDLLLAMGGFDSDYRLAADYALLLEAVLHRRARYAHIPVVSVSYQGGGASERQSALMARERRQVVQRFYPAWERGLYGLLQSVAVDPARRVFHLFGSLLSTGMRERLYGR